MSDRTVRLSVIAGAAALAGGTISDWWAWELGRAAVDAACAAWLVWSAIRLRPERFIVAGELVPTDHG
jgi:hypothetical protein